MLLPDNKIFGIVGQSADNLGREAYVVGGYVRDLMLHRPSKDIDFVTVGSGIELAREVASHMGRNATVTVAHSRTRDLPEICRQADILVAAVGRLRFITEEMVAPGAVVIDVGVNRDPETGKLAGDVDY